MNCCSMEQEQEKGSEADKLLDHVQTSSTNHTSVANTNVMSEEEQKIRDELESEIERDLEEEIKDGMRRLALRLQRLYLHKKHRKSTSSTNSNTEPSFEPNSEPLCELYITIRSDGKSMIKTYEVKPSFRNMVRPYSSWSEAKQEKLHNCISRFDRSKSLRLKKGLMGATLNGNGLPGDSKMNGSLRFEPPGKCSDTSSKNEKLFERKNKKKIGLDWKY